MKKILSMLVLVVFALHTITFKISAQTQNDSLYTSGMITDEVIIVEKGGFEDVDVSITSDYLNAEVSDDAVGYATTFHNISGKVVVNNTDKPDLGETPFENAVIGIYEYTDINWENPLDIVVSDSQGKFTFENVVSTGYTRYNIQMISVPSGFQKSNLMFDLTLNSNSPANYTLSRDYTVTPILSNIQGFVQDKETNDPLGNAVIQISDSNRAVLAEVETGLDGKFSFENLRYGKYIITQITTSEGFITSNENYEVNIDDTYVATDIIILNEKINTSTPGDNNTGDIDDNPADTTDTPSSVTEEKDSETNSGLFGSPETSDSSNMHFYFILMPVSLIVLYIMKKRSGLES